MTVDKRTFIIAVVIVVIALPIIVLVFHKTFFPIIISMKNTFVSAALMNSNTGIPLRIMHFFK